jgi:hypothetical protein
VKAVGRWEGAAPRIPKSVYGVSWRIVGDTHIAVTAHIFDILIFVVFWFLLLALVFLVIGGKRCTLAMHSPHVNGCDGPGQVEDVTGGEWAAWALKATPSSNNAITDPDMLASNSFLGGGWKRESAVTQKVATGFPPASQDAV